MSFSHFGELWLAGSHGGGITSGPGCMQPRSEWQDMAPGQAPWGFRTGCRGSMGQSELGAVALLKVKGTLRRRLSHGYFSFIAKYTSN